MKNKKGISFMITAALLLAAGCGNAKGNEAASDAAKAETQEKVSVEAPGTEGSETDVIKLGVTTGLNDHYIALVGIENGFFQENGIDLQLVEFATGIETIDATTSGQVDIGKAADFAIVNRIGNTDGNFKGKLIAKFESSQNYALYADPEKIHSIEDLKGQKIVTNPGTVLDYLNALTLEAAGISEDDVTILNVGSGQEAVGLLVKKEASAYWANGNGAVKVKEAGYEKVIGMEDLGTSVDDYYVASDDYIAAHSDRIGKFLKGAKESAQWITEHQDEAAAIIVQKLGVDESLVKANLNAASLGLDFPQSTVDHLEEIQTYNSGRGFYENPYEIKDFIDTGVLKEVLPDAEIYE